MQENHQQAITYCDNHVKVIEYEKVALQVKRDIFNRPSYRDVKTRYMTLLPINMYQAQMIQVKIPSL